MAQFPNLFIRNKIFKTDFLFSKKNRISDFVLCFNFIFFLSSDSFYINLFLLESTKKEHFDD